MTRDVRALDVQDLHRCIRELADVFDSEEWRTVPLPGALVAAALHKATDIGGRRGSRLSQQLRSVIRRNLRRRTLGDELQPGRPLQALPVVEEKESHT